MVREACIRRYLKSVYQLHLIPDTVAFRTQSEFRLHPPLNSNNCKLIENALCVEERQEEYWCDSPTVSLNLVFWKLDASILKNHRSPGTPNEKHHPAEREQYR